MKALVLSSGGADSTTCLAMAIKKFGKENVQTVSFNYGQKHKKELQAIKKVAEFYGVKNTTLNLGKIFEQSNNALMAKSTRAVEKKSYEEQIKETGEVNTYVPFRNGVMLAVVASLAYSIFNGEKAYVYVGVHADDSAKNAYPDCSQKFIDAMTEAINLGTYKKIKVVAPLVNMTKAEVVKMGLKLKVPYQLTWSCYEGKGKACGKCATCLDRKKAFELNGAKDPIEYEE